MITVKLKGVLFNCFFYSSPSSFYYPLLYHSSLPFITARAAAPTPSAGPPAGNDRPANPMAGNLLAGIAGFKKNELSKAETVDKSAPVAAKSGPGGGAGGGAGGPPKPMGGGGPFGIPAGGIAGLKAQQAAAGMFFFTNTLYFPFERLFISLSTIISTSQQMCHPPQILSIVYR